MWQQHECWTGGEARRLLLYSNTKIIKVWPRLIIRVARIDEKAVMILIGYM